MFFTDAKAEHGRAWIGGFLEIGTGMPRSVVFIRSYERLGTVGLFQQQPEQSDSLAGASGYVDSRDTLGPRVQGQADFQASD